MNRRDGIMRLIRMRLEGLESCRYDDVKKMSHRCLDALRLLEDYEKDRSAPPMNVWGALKRIVRCSESIVSEFDTIDRVPDRLVEVMREDLKALVDCEINKVV